MPRYILGICRINSCGDIVHLYDVPLNGIVNEHDASEQAKKLKHCLKDDYIVSISKIDRWSIGYVATDK